MTSHAKGGAGTRPLPTSQVMSPRMRRSVMVGNAQRVLEDASRAREDGPRFAWFAYPLKAKALNRLGRSRSSGMIDGGMILVRGTRRLDTT